MDKCRSGRANLERLSWQDDLMRAWVGLLLIGCQVSPASVDTERLDLTCFAVDPPVVEFPELSGGDRASAHARITNLSGGPLTLHQSPARPPFTITPSEDTELAPGDTASLRIDFAPTDGLLHLETIALTTPGLPECAAQLTMRGLGGGKLFASPLDFGRLEVGDTTTQDLIITNGARVPVTVEAPRFDVAANVATLTVGLAFPLTLTAGASVRVPVTATVLLPEDVAGSFTLPSSLGAVTEPVALLVGTPKAELAAVPVDVPIFGSMTSGTDREVVLRNVGTPGGPSSRLRLVPPFARVVSQDSSELFVFQDPTVAMSGLRAGSSTEVQLRLMPRGLGRHTWQVTLLTNAPQTPELTFTVTTTSVELPPCSLTQSPDSLPVPGDGGTARLTLTNVGTERCVLDHLRLGVFGFPVPNEAGDRFEIVSGGFSQLELAPGAVHHVDVARQGRPSVSSVRYLVFQPNATERSATVFSN